MTASNSKVMAIAMQSKTDIFIQKARLVFGDTFGYQCTRYVKNTIKIKINCPKHGLFEQTPKQHLKGSNGCKKCNGEKGRLTTEEFIKRSESKHRNKYKYDRAVYAESTTKVQIFCIKCVKYFYQLPHCHMNGQGCPVCAKQLRGARLKYPLEKFVELAKEKHGSNHYDYSLVEYRTAMDKVKIKCLVHDGILNKRCAHI